MRRVTDTSMNMTITSVSDVNFWSIAIFQFTFFILFLLIGLSSSLQVTNDEAVPFYYVPFCFMVAHQSPIDSSASKV